MEVGGKWREQGRGRNQIKLCEIGSKCSRKMKGRRTVQW